MTNDLDTLLNDLAAAPVPERLAAIEAHVWSGIAAERRGGRAALAIGGAAAVGAVVMGVAAGGLASRPAAAAVVPFGAGAPLAPSTLLLGAK